MTGLLARLTGRKRRLTTAEVELAVARGEMTPPSPHAVWSEEQQAFLEFGQAVADARQAREADPAWLDGQYEKHQAAIREPLMPDGYLSQAELSALSRLIGAGGGGDARSPATHGTVTSAAISRIERGASHATRAQQDSLYRALARIARTRIPAAARDTLWWIAVRNWRAP